MTMTFDVGIEASGIACASPRCAMARGRSWPGTSSTSFGSLPGCRAPLSPLAQQQPASATSPPAADTRARVVRAGPESEPARRARALRLALLGGMARGYQRVGESYLEGSKSAGAAAYASQMRAVALAYFGRVRRGSLEMRG